MKKVSSSFLGSFLGKIKSFLFFAWKLSTCKIGNFFHNRLTLLGLKVSSLGNFFKTVSSLGKIGFPKSFLGGFL